MSPSLTNKPQRSPRHHGRNPPVNHLPCSAAELLLNRQGVPLTYEVHEGRVLELLDYEQSSLFFLVRRTKRARIHTRVTEGARRERLDALSRAWLTEEKKLRLLAVEKGCTTKEWRNWLVRVYYSLAVWRFKCRFAVSFTFIWRFTVKKLSCGCGKS